MRHIQFISGLLLTIVLSTTSLYYPAYAQPQLIQQNVSGSDRALELRLIPAGKFDMGTDSSGKKEVAVSAFYMSIYETTWEQYNAFFTDVDFSANNMADAVTRPSPPYLDFTLGMGKDGFPASSMQQYGALMFCKWLFKKTGEFYRLPTEAEWEYACLAGSNATTACQADESCLQTYAWYAPNSNGKYQPVGKLKPNAWGLFDMQGNVAEWVLDQYAADYFNLIADKNIDPIIVATKRNPRSVRGGSYRDNAAALGCAVRTMADPVWNRRDPQIPKSRWWNTDAPFVGFRVVKPLKQPSAKAAEEFFNTYLIK